MNIYKLEIFIIAAEKHQHVKAIVSLERGWPFKISHLALYEHIMRKLNLSMIKHCIA